MAAAVAVTAILAGAPHAASAAPEPTSVVELLDDAFAALSRGDDDAYSAAVSALESSGEWLPAGTWTALDERDDTTIALSSTLLAADEQGLMVAVLDVITWERDAVRLAASGATADRLYAERMDGQGLLVLEVLDERELVVQDSTRALLGPIDPERLGAPYDLRDYEDVIGVLAGRLGITLPPAHFPSIDPSLVAGGEPPAGGVFDGAGQPAGTAVADGGAASQSAGTAIADGGAASQSAGTATADGGAEGQSAGTAIAEGASGSSDAALGSSSTVRQPTMDDDGGLRSESGAFGLTPVTMGVGAVALAGLGLSLSSWFRGRRHERFADLAFRDALTGLNNRRRFDDDLAGFGARRDQPTAVLMLDVDHFKRLNDTHGHAIGDEVLRQIGGTIGRTVRAGDVAYRYGGEEFSVLLPGATADEARTVALRLGDAIRDLRVPVSDDETVGVTASIGLALGASESLSELVLEADHAMYSAKETGRDRLVMSGATVGAH